MTRSNLLSHITYESKQTRASYGVSIVKILEKIDRVIMVPYCTYIYIVYCTYIKWKELRRKHAITDQNSAGTGPIHVHVFLFTGSFHRRPPGPGFRKCHIVLTHCAYKIMSIFSIIFYTMCFKLTLFSVDECENISTLLTSLPRLAGAFDFGLAVSVPLPIVMGIFVLLWFQSRLT